MHKESEAPVGFEKKNFAFQINKSTEGMLILEDVGIISLRLFNFSKRRKPLSDYHVDFAMRGCDISSSDSRWRDSTMLFNPAEEDKALSYYGDARFDDNLIDSPGGKLFPDIRNHCVPGKQNGLVIILRLSGGERFVYDMPLAKF